MNGTPTSAARDCNRRPLLRLCMNRINDNRPPGSERKARALATDGVDFVGDLCRISLIRQSRFRGDAEQPLPLDIASHMNGSRKGADMRGDRRRHS